ncbi:polyphosphate kinase [Catalinimonas alkaloidigena]|uniref:Polyphosphate kinase n=1 Tax=Catalinimonas alkaloidigena TaxID=1075417 RepID=A0A1G9KB97_9BACT|nr:polyphosphate kinase 1 [Catalinimonas alkaloidigena]SDL46856.1 polyphosphate kinase [Catalinimonas alkaloidigena]
MPNKKIQEQILSSNLVSRDLSWIQFNYRVLDQARDPEKTVFERLKFLAITASNFDEFFMIRVGSLYNYLDYGKERVDYSGLREKPFRAAMLHEAQDFFQQQYECFTEELMPQFTENGFGLIKVEDLTNKEREKVLAYFVRTIFPMLTPMVFDQYHTFPILMNRILIFGVVTSSPNDQKAQKKISFVQIPQNLPRFYEIDRGDAIAFLPIEEIIRWQIEKLYRNVRIESTDLFRITRNGDFSLEESDDLEEDFVDEVKRKLKTRRTGRVVRIEVEDNYSSYMMRVLKSRWELDNDNIFITNQLLDLTGLWQIIGHVDFRDKVPTPPLPVLPLTGKLSPDEGLFEYLKTHDILLHHPYNRIDPLVQLLEESAEDPQVLGIKITIYRLAKESRVTNALLKAAENGKHVSVLFEVKARFDEENNIREAQRLQKAGCFVIYGVGSVKTHTKLMLIVRKEGEKVTRYVHLSSGNYNEDTARLYTDIGLLTTNEIYAHDVSEFFNVITGHSSPNEYHYLLTAPRDMRDGLINLIRHEAKNAQEGLPSGIVIKVNSLEDKESIEALYAASQAGVPIRLIVRGICCLRPGRPGLSENITVRSIVGEFLEHGRLYYFHNAGEPKVFGGSADMMTRSFTRRIESLFLMVDDKVKQEAINILDFNLKDNVNAYLMEEDGQYVKRLPGKGEQPFNIHREFYNVTEETVAAASLFDDLEVKNDDPSERPADKTVNIDS